MNKILYKKALADILESVEENNKSFLITGASGMIGSCLIDVLMLANENGKCNHVYAIGRSIDKLQKIFNDYLSSEYFHIIEQDVCDPIDDNVVFDYIIHGASNADPVKYTKYPVETMNTNLLGGINVLEYARKHTQCIVEILSTFEVYGVAEQEEYSEQDVGKLDFNNIRSCYPESKRAVETLTQCYVYEYGINVTTARLCSVYGPTMMPDDSKAHAQFLRNVLRGESIVMKSKGDQTRMYCYIMDAVAGVFCVLFRGESGQAYNIGNEKSIVTISDVAHTISYISGYPVVYKTPSNEEKKCFCQPINCILNNKKIKDLGWQGKYDLYHGISECLSILGLDSK